MDSQTLALSFGLGLMLAAATGIRAFIAPLLISAMANADIIQLDPQLAWLGSPVALATFVIAIVLEVAADKFPFLDHVMDALHVLVKPAAGALTMVTVLDGMDGLVPAVGSLIAGGVVAGGTHIGKATLRLGSTATTAGAGNPILSIIEDVAALTLAGATAYVMA